MAAARWPQTELAGAQACASRERAAAAWQNTTSGASCNGRIMFLRLQLPHIMTAPASSNRFAAASERLVSAAHVSPGEGRRFQRVRWPAAAVLSTTLRQGGTAGRDGRAGCFGGQNVFTGALTRGPRIKKWPPTRSGLQATASRPSGLAVPPTRAARQLGRCIQQAPWLAERSGIKCPPARQPASPPAYPG
jgi:hypothetical protein